MIGPPAGPVGDHWDRLERLFEEQYRREFENEENIWRSLPFFSATLALQVAVVVQVAPLVAAARGGLAWLLSGLVVANAALAAGVLFFLARSIGLWHPSSGIAGEPQLTAYVDELDAYFAEHGKIDDRDRTPAEALRRLLIGQYADATTRNRRLNRARARARGLAGALLVASTAATLVLAGAAAGPQLFSGRAAAGDGYGQSPSTRPGQAGVTASPPAGDRRDAGAAKEQAGAADPAADADRDRELVEPEGARRDA